MNTKQKHVRTIVDVEGEERIERLTFYYSILPNTEEELSHIVSQEFPLVSSKDITLERRASGSLLVIPPKPQLRPESLKKKQYTLMISPKRTKMSLLSKLRALGEFQTVDIIYDPPLVLDL